jgi:TIR domain/Carbohydrate binding module (family 6)
MQVFVSYARRDRDRAERIVRALEAHGLVVFWDPEIPPGTQTYNTYLGERLDEADRAVVLWTGSSAASRWVIEEANEALGRGKLVPVLLDDVEPPLGFRSVQTLDLRGWDGRPDDQRIRQLVDAITRRTIRPLPGPAPRRRHRHVGATLFVLVLVAGAALTGWFLYDRSRQDGGVEPLAVTTSVGLSESATSGTGSPPTARAIAAVRLQGESYDEQSPDAGFQRGAEGGDGYLSYITDGTWVSYRSIGSGSVASIRIRAASDSEGGVVELRTGQDRTIGTCFVEPTGGWLAFELFDCDVTGADVDDTELYLFFAATGRSANPYLFNIDWVELT